MKETDFPKVILMNIASRQSPWDSSYVLIVSPAPNTVPGKQLVPNK
jgi:hypothetical protein